MNRADLMEEYDVSRTDVIHSDSSISKEQSTIVYRSICIVTFSVFSALAVCLVFAPNLLDHVENYSPNKHLSDEQKEVFEHGISMAAIGTFIFRFGHNIIFVKFRARTRYVIGLLCMIIMMSIIIIAFFIIQTQQLWWIYIAYAFAGITFGLNEPNLFKSIAYLGEKSKLWSFYGFGAGFNVTMVVGLWALSVGLPLMYIYISVIILSLISIVIYLLILHHHDKLIESNSYILFGGINTRIDDVQIESKSLTWNMFKLQLREWRNWFKIIIPFGIVVLCNYFMLNAFGTIPFYVMISGKVPLVGNVWINRDILFSVTGILWVIGSFLSYALLHYSERIKHFVLNYPSTIVLMHICGALLSSCAFFIQPLLNVIGSAIVNFAFGFIYKTAVTYVELNIDAKYRLISLSLLFMFGDIGATVGVNTFPFIVQLVCDNTSESYYCDNG
eukprot:160925_1